MRRGAESRKIRGGVVRRGGGCTRLRNPPVALGPAPTIRPRAVFRPPDRLCSPVPQRLLVAAGGPVPPAGAARAAVAAGVGRVRRVASPWVRVGIREPWVAHRRGRPAAAGADGGRV